MVQVQGPSLPPPLNTSANASENSTCASFTKSLFLRVGMGEPFGIEEAEEGRGGMSVPLAPRSFLASRACTMTKAEVPRCCSTCAREVREKGLASSQRRVALGFDDSFFIWGEMSEEAGRGVVCVVVGTRTSGFCRRIGGRAGGQKGFGGGGKQRGQKDCCAFVKTAAFGGERGGTWVRLETRWRWKGGERRTTTAEWQLSLLFEERGGGSGEMKERS
ncbi:hypothetical protein EJ06DRAFT_147745 [Trichodelitschia bisporula]|uniref:Uncharacterized protein n=1 Tax=Trichodelitschia bisporula TaxID=703511 RepID=A0A6G1HNC1_9PEZI|nr:hypothetical protein EJ06DRAFT_147745 [Trichodelitschia bisporula]